MTPIDPGALLEIEKSARHVATEMSHVMDNLRNSLYAVSIYGTIGDMDLGLASPPGIVMWGRGYCPSPMYS